MKQQDGKARIKIALVALLVSVVIALISVLFVSSVREQLWQQSIGTIRESTQQGMNTLRVQLQEEYRVMESLTNYLKKYTAGQTEELDGLISSYSRMDNGIVLYLEDGTIVIAPLIPWSIAGAVPLASMGAPGTALFAGCYLYALPLWRLITDCFTRGKQKV